MAGWMKEATKNAHGQFAAKAHKRGMSTRAFAARVNRNPDEYDERTRKQAALAAVLMRSRGQS